MANPIKGEVLVEVESGQYTLAYTLGACAAIEGQFEGRRLQDILGDLEGDAPKIGTMQVVIWAGLQKHHGEVTLKGAGDLVALHEMPIWGAALGKAFSLAKPEAKSRKRPRAATAE